MRFLLDENIPLRLQKRLVAAGFEEAVLGVGKVILSRVPQNVPLRDRVEIWFTALEAFWRDPQAGQLFDLLPTGRIVGWEIRRTDPSS